MQIHCSKREDILRRKSEYEMEFNRRKQLHEDQYSNYREAEKIVNRDVERQVLDAIGDVSIDIQVAAMADFGDGYRVQVRSYDSDVFNPDKALSWTYTVRLSGTGDILKESSSWSGLQATTKTQLDSLRATLSVLETLNDMDWGSILTTAVSRYPDYDAYVTESDPSYDRDKPNFDKELLEADLDECVGKDILIRGRGNYPTYYGILKSTPKQFVIYSVPGYTLQDSWLDENHYSLSEIVDINKAYSERITKDKFYKLIEQPIKTLEV